jgi:hypothetical protein
MLIVFGVCWDPEPVGLVLLSANKIAKIFKYQVNSYKPTSDPAIKASKKYFFKVHRS